MSASVLSTIQSQLEQLHAHANAFQSVPRQPPPDDSEVLQEKVVKETGRLIAELKESAQTAFGTESPYFGPPLPEPERQDAFTEVCKSLEELKGENSAESVDHFLNEASENIKSLVEIINNGQLPANLVLKGVQTYVQAPLKRWLGADALSRKIADDVSHLSEQQAALQETYNKALAEAQTRVERQSIKAQHFQEKEQFFTDALARLESHVESDRTVVSSLQTQGTPEIEEAQQAVQSLVKGSILMRQHVRNKGLSYESDPKQLQELANSLQNRLDSNSLKLHASLTETLKLLQEHTELQTELTNVLMNQKIRDQVENVVEAKRTELLTTIDGETQRLSATQEAVGTFLGLAQGFAEKIRGICTEQQNQAQARMHENAAKFAGIYQEYYEQLQELHAGKLKCMKALQVELKRLLKEQTRWEGLEHELPGAQQLVKLDERLTQIKDFQAQLENEADVLQKKLDALKECGTDILPQVPDFVHPSEALALERAEQLVKKKQKLEGLLSKYGPVEFMDEDLDYDSSSAETIMEPSNEIERHIVESPYKLKRHLQRVTEELNRSPYASRLLGTTQGASLPEVEGTQVAEPTAEMLQMALKTKKAPETRGTAFGNSKKRKRGVKPAAAPAK